MVLWLLGLMMHKLLKTKNRILRSEFFCLVFLLSLIIGTLDSWAEEEPIGKVIAISGKVEFATLEQIQGQEKKGLMNLVKFSPWKTTEFQQLVYAKDVYKTKRRSRLKILFNDNSLIALGPGSTMKVQSYLYSPEEKLRRTTVDIAKGFAMYIINKSQKNPNSNFKIVSPVANLSSRGTQGYISSFSGETIVANQAGSMTTENRNSAVPGSVIVGPMSRTIVESGKPPELPSSLSGGELSAIRTGILGQVEALSSSTNQLLINIQKENAESEDEEDVRDSIESSSAADEEEIDSRKDYLDALSEGKDGFARPGGNGQNLFFRGKVGPGDKGYGNSQDYASFNDPFEPDLLSSCGP
jgi:hypothetical protein